MKRILSKKNLFLFIFDFSSIFLLMVFFSADLFANLRFTGPNPYYSFLSFPQDGLLFGKKSGFLFVDFGSRGWMGNLDNPSVSPSPTYVATRESVKESFENGINPEAAFSGKWIAPSFRLTPYIFDTNSIRIIPLISVGFDIFDLASSGTAIAREGSEKFLVDFDSKLSQTNSTYSAGFILILKKMKYPIGILFNYTDFRESKPEGHLNYNMGGKKYLLNRFNWGWSTSSSCNHIFGPSTNIDAFWQDYYTDTRYSKTDIIVGSDRERYRFGFHYRNRSGRKDFYEFNSGDNGYQKSKWGEKISENMFRGYDILKLGKFLGGDLNVVGLLEYDMTKNPYTNNGTVIEDYYKKDNFGGEILPFLHYNLSGGGFLRMGTSVSFFRENYKYIEIWGSQKVYGSGWYDYDWEEWWERSSYGNSSTFTIFSEADMEIVLTERRRLTLVSHLWSMFNIKRTKRYFGNNTEDENGLYVFNKSAKRTNFLKELWIGGTFGIQTGRDKIFGIFYRSSDPL